MKFMTLNYSRIVAIRKIVVISLWLRAGLIIIVKFLVGSHRFLKYILCFYEIIYHFSLQNRFPIGQTLYSVI